MQGLARFSLIAAIVLAAVLLGAWAYLNARYGGIDEFLASDDAPRHWQPGSRSEAHDDEPAAQDHRSLTDKTADAVKAGKIPEDESGDWRNVEPEKAPGESSKSPKTADTAPKETIEAFIDTEFTDLAIHTEDETLTRNTTKSNLKPFFARTRPNATARHGYTEEHAFRIAKVEGGAKSPELQELEKLGYTIILGKVVDNQKLEGIENVVVAPVDQHTKEPHSNRAVTNRRGEFVLYLSVEEAKDCGATSRKVRLCVIADGMNPASKAERLHVNSESDANGMHEIKLEKSRGLRVRVRVANPRPLEDEVRVWCELRDQAGPTFDDHIFMSVLAPARGDIVFRLPRGHWGTVRVGASGKGWAADAVETDKITKDIVAISLTLRSARTELCSGVVCGVWYENGETEGPRSAARVAATGSTDIAYTDAAGRFEFFARKESDPMSLRISTVDGFVRSYELAYVPKGDEGRRLMRTLFDTHKQAHEWQFLAPANVLLTVELDRLDEDERNLLLFPVPLPGQARKPSSKEEGKEVWRDSVRVGSRVLEYKFQHANWGTRVFILFKLESATKYTPLATYICAADFWETTEFVVTLASTDGLCQVSARMPLTRN